MKFYLTGPWIQGTLISLMDRYKNGIIPPGPEDACDHDGLTTGLPLILQQTPNLNMDQLKSCFQIMSTKDDAINHYKAEAFLINEFIKGTENPIEVTRAKFGDDENISREIDAVLEGKRSGQSAKELVKKFGMACPMPGSFQGSLVSILGAESYAGAIRETIFCGGDCCSRSNLIGACLGAKYGIDSMPLDWISKVDGIEEILHKCIKVFG